MAEPLQPCRHDGLPARLAAEADAVTEHLMERVLEEIPLYRTLDPVQLADVRETVRLGYLAALELWATGSLAGPEQVARFRANGATRAAEGRPLPLVLRAYRVTALGIYDHVVGHPDVQLDPEEERNFARLVMAFVDQLSNEVTIGYVETTGQLASQQGRARRDFLDDLLAGRLLGAAEIAERAATLGLTLPRDPCLVLAAPPVGEGSALADRARIAVAELSRARGEGDGPASRVQLITRGRLVLIDERIDHRTLRRVLDGAGLKGVVLDVPDLTDLATAYRRAQLVLDYAQSAVVPAHSAISDDDALALALLARTSEDPAAAPMIAATLRGLAAPDHQDLRNTLDAYLAAGNAVSAAHSLGIHAQTMRYRLRRIREITGRDPAHGWDRFLLELALRLSRRTGASDPA